MFKFNMIFLNLIIVTYISLNAIDIDYSNNSTKSIDFKITAVSYNKDDDFEKEKSLGPGDTSSDTLENAKYEEIHVEVTSPNEISDSLVLQPNFENVKATFEESTDGVSINLTGNGGMTSVGPKFIANDRTI